MSGIRGGAAGGGRRPGGRSGGGKVGGDMPEVNSPERAAAGIIFDLERRIKALERSNQLERGSVVGQNLDVYDEAENLAVIVGEQFDGTFNPTALRGPEPPIPTVPILTPGLRSVTVHWDGEWEPEYEEDGVTILDDQVVTPMDFARVEIHASTDPGFTAEFADTLMGTFETPRGGDQIVPIPTVGEEYTIKLVARSLSGARGDASDGATVAAVDASGSDGDPPAASPATVTVTPQVGAIRLSWDPVVNADPVMYRIYASTSPTVPTSADTIIGEVMGTSFNATHGDLAPLTPLPYDVDTYFRVWAMDVDGAAPAPSAASAGAKPKTGVTDGVPPATAPSIVVQPGIGSLHVKWGAVPNADPVTYRVYGTTDLSLATGGTSEWPEPTGEWAFISEIRGTSVTIRRLAAAPPDTPTHSAALNPDRPVYLWVRASDGDGYGPFSQYKVATPAQATHDDIAANAINADHIDVNSIYGHMFAGEVMLGSTISTGFIDEVESSPTYGQVIGQRVELGQTGMKLVDVAGNEVVKFPTDPTEQAYVRARLETEELRVRGGTSIESTTNEIAKDAGLTLSAGTTAPVSSPVMSHGYDYVQLQRIASEPHEPAFGNLGSFALNYSRIRHMSWHRGLNHWIVAEKVSGGTRIWHYEANGQVVVRSDGKRYVDDLESSGEMIGMWGYDNGQGGIGYAVWQPGNEEITISARMGGNAGAFGNPWTINLLPWAANDNGVEPIAFYDYNADNICIAQNNYLTAGGNRVLRVVRYVPVQNPSPNNWWPPTQVGAVNSSATAVSNRTDLAGMAASAFDYGGGTRFAFGYLNSSALVGVSTGVGGGWSHDTPLRFAPATPPVGFDWSGTAFHVLGSDGRLYTHTGWTWADGLDHVHGGISWYDSDLAGTPSPPTNDGTHETTIGAIASLALPKRAKLFVQVPVVPDKGGTDDPNKFRLYMKRSGSAKPAASALIYQTEGGSPTATTTLVFTSLGTSSPISPPTSNNFPGASPAYVKSGGQHTLVGAAGGTFVRDVFRVDGFGDGWWDKLVPPGSLMLWPRTSVLVSGLVSPEVAKGWLLCQGGVVSRSAYPALFAVIGTLYNTGSEAGTDFRLPDLRGRFPIGQGGSLGKALGEKGGNDQITLSVGQMPSHTHTANWSNDVGSNNGWYRRGDSAATTGTGTAMIEPAGSGNPIDILPPFIAINFIIRY